MKTIVGLYDHLTDAHNAVDALVNAGIDRGDISLVASDPNREYSSVLGDGTMTAEATMAPPAGTADDAAVEGAVAGGVIGGLAGLLLGLGAFAIPGIGPIVGAGPLVAALVGAGIGAASGGLLGALVGWGVPETEAGYYAEGVRRGGTLVAVRTPDNMVDRVVTILNMHSPVDVQQRATEWRSAGWMGYNPDAEPYSADEIETWRSRRMTSGTGTTGTTTGTGSSRVHVWSAAAGDGGSFATGQAGALETRGGSFATGMTEMDRDFESFGPTFRSHYQTTYATTGRPYSEYEPSYRFGYDLAYGEDYRGREWDDLAEDAARDWGAQFDQAWEDVKDTVRYAWNQVRDALDMDDDGRVLDMDTGRPTMRGVVSEEWSGVRRSFRPAGGSQVMRDLHDVLVEEIQDLHSAETQILQALPKMINAAWSNELRTALQDHLAQTQTHVTRLQQIAGSISQSPQGKECKGMRGLIQEGDEVLHKPGPSATRDAALIGAAQRVEHYEMASYGTARTHARELGYNEIADLLQTTLDEEGDADKLLTSIAEGGLFEEGINEMAEKSM
jgi:ferritin-like metal-binding protein YciE